MENRPNTKIKLAALAGIILFVFYNIIVFVAAGFTGHTATFWWSWGFTIIGMIAIGVSFLFLNVRGRVLKDWIFGFPIMGHSTVFAIAVIITSSLFIVFEKHISWKVAIPVLLVELAIYLVFAISCFIVREHIQEVRQNVKEHSAFIKMLRVDVEMIAEKCNDEATKAQITKLAENVRYSDIMSHELLASLENEISFTVSKCDEAVAMEDYEAARTLCSRADILLKERNKKCMLLKK